MVSIRRPAFAEVFAAHFITVVDEWEVERVLFNWRINQ